MNWIEQAESMMKTLTEAQKKAWEGWYELARSGPNTAPFTFNFTDPSQLFRQGIEAWTAGIGTTGQGMAKQLLNGQQAMMRNLEMLTKSWQIVAPYLDAGENWQEGLKKFTDQWTEQILGNPARWLEATAHTNELWQSFIGEWGPLLKPWVASVNQLLHGHLGEGLLGTSSGLNRFLNLEMDGLSRLFDMEADREMAFERVAEIPTVGYTREQNTMLLKAFDAFVDLRKADIQYRTMLATTMGEAVRETMNKLANLAKEGKSINSVRELTRLWLEIADKVFSEMYSSEEYIQVQNDLSSAGLKYKIEAQKVIEMVLEVLHIPTRSELDDTYRTLYELRKEVKALKKQVHTLTQELSEGAKTTVRKTPPTRRRTTVKSKTTSV
jgi:class III poly(R)-hydroxyalkanoic acid synthase PhaE subunit